MPCGIRICEFKYSDIFGPSQCPLRNTFCSDLFIILSFRDVKTSRDTSATTRGRGRGGARGERGARGRGGGQSSRGALVSSSGLFSEGAGDGTSRRTLSSRLRGSGESSESAQLRRPTIIKKEKHDPLQEQQQIKDIYALDNELMDEEKSSNDSFSPINLIGGMLYLRGYYFSSFL